MNDTELDLPETTIDFEDEDTLELSFTDDETEDFEESTWEWDGTQWKKVA
jgi:hypothetical protein